MPTTDNIEYLSNEDVEHLNALADEYVRQLKEYISDRLKLNEMDDEQSQYNLLVYAIKYAICGCINNGVQVNEYKFNSAVSDVLHSFTGKAKQGA